MIRLSRESMEDAFVKYLETVFEHPEIIRASVRNMAFPICLRSFSSFFVAVPS